MDLQTNEVRIKLTGATNFRDLGGFPAAGGRRTSLGVFFRSDSLQALTQDDIDKLLGLGITRQIDLRSQYEISLNPSRLECLAGVEYINFSLLDNIQSSGLQNLPDDMSMMYCQLLDDNRQKLGGIFQALESTQGGCVFNCTAGKDRAGIVAMLLLSLAGVDDDIIVNDYIKSEANMESMFAVQKEKLATAGIVVPNGIFRADPTYITSAMTHLRSRYGDAFGYLTSCGVTQAQIQALRDRFVEE